MVGRAQSLLFVLSLGASAIGGLTGCDQLSKLVGLSESSSGSSRGERGKSDDVAEPQLAYVGREACAECHQDVVESYAWSQHDRALEMPEEHSVAAPFEGEQFAGREVGGIFTTQESRPVIQSGKSHPVKWVIGVQPLQQYLVDAERGRVQAFPIAYDTRDAGDGGKRWYMLDERDVPEGDVMHWQEDAANWNSMCAECHSTHVQKNYDIDKDSYDTQFTEIDVSCEACHGPGSRHIDLAKKYASEAKWPAEVLNAGFDVALATYALRRWVRGPDDRVAHLEGNGDVPPEETHELALCAPCHSHRTDFGPATAETLFEPFDERYRLSLLTSDLYFPDGQIKEEVYVYGSFLQSKMHAAGVVCSDCHNQHATTLRKPVVDLCVTCHNPDIYEEDSHHMHPAEAEVTCVDCHMPERTYMGVDARRDHQFSVPRPDLTLTLGTPSACEACHPHRPKWAAAVIEEHFGSERPTSFAPIFHAADERQVDAPEKLASLVRDENQPVLIRASALSRWSALGRLSLEFTKALSTASQAKSPLLRRTAAEAARPLPPEERARILKPLLEDSVRSVRVAAALTSVNGPTPGKLSDAHQKALKEARDARRHDADRPAGLLALAAIEHRLGNAKEMDRLYRLAAERYPQSSVVFVNWADALRETKKEKEAQQVLLDGLKLHKDEPSLLHSRGLWLVREKKVTEALPLLQQAFEKAPATLRRRYGYVYAIAVEDSGDWAEGLAILRQLKNEYPEAKEVADAIKLWEEKRARK